MKDFIQQYKMNKAMEVAKQRLIKKAAPEIMPGEGIKKESASASPSGKPRGVPVGTIHNGRQKVSDNPSKWIDLHTGHTHDDHKTAEKHKTRTPETESIVNDTIGKLKGKIHSDDIKPLTEKLHKYIEAKQLANNLVHAANQTSSQGEYQHFDVASKQVFKKKDEATALKKEFIAAARESIKRNR